MGPQEDDASSRPVIKLASIAEQRERAIERIKATREKNAAAAQQENASLQAAQTARDATIEIEGLCAAVELTQDRVRHVELLQYALRGAAQAMCALVSVRPVTDPTGWLSSVYGQGVERDVEHAKDLRMHKRRFAGFLEVVCRQLSAGSGTLNVKHIVGDGVACVAPDAVSIPVGLADMIGKATSLLDSALEGLRANGSSVVAWNQARSAQDILGGSLVVMASAAVGEAFSLDHPARPPAAYLCAISGAALVEQGFAQLNEIR
jgi:hypothetical protein